MKKLYKIVYSSLVLLLLSFALGCGLDQKSNPTTGKTAPWTNSDSIVKSKELRVISTIWVDSLIEKYIQFSKSDPVRAAINNKLSEEWLFDQIKNTDTAVYLIYQIGHDVSDEGGTNPRFITDQWVYLDTTTRTLYEYNFLKDSLIYWSK